MTNADTPQQLGTRELAARTPDSRDRYVDFLRAASIAVVVCGHWLMACVTLRDGRFHADNALALIPHLWLATWVLQVMPVFFFVGGFSNSVTIDGMRRRGQGGVEFVVSRAERLLRPIAVLLGVWVPHTIAAEALGVSRGAVGPATRLVCQPLWFVGAYLLVTVFAPWLRDLHTRFSWRVPVGLVATAALVDGLRFGAHVPAVGWCNVLFVWLLAQQLGFFYADGTLVRCTRQALTATAFVAVGVLVLLTTFGPYPGSMVGLPGAKVSNMAPPTLCMVALTLFQVALVMLARDAGENRWLARPRVWTPVVALNGVIMTVFLWHLTAMMIVVGVGFPMGFPQPEPGTAAWWATRPLWIATLLVPLVGLAALLGRLERPPARELRAATAPSTPWRAGLGAALTVLGVTGLAANNLAGLLGGAHAGQVIAWSMTARQSLLALGGGWLLLRSTLVARTR